VLLLRPILFHRLADMLRHTNVTAMLLLFRNGESKYVLLRWSNTPCPSQRGVYCLQFPSEENKFETKTWQNTVAESKCFGMSGEKCIWKEAVAEVTACCCLKGVLFAYSSAALTVSS